MKIRAFNWAGSKYQDLDKINFLLKGKSFNRVIDGLMVLWVQVI